MAIVDYFPAHVALNPQTGGNLPDAVVEFFAIDDEEFTTPVTVTDVQDVPLGTSVTSGATGVFPAFKAPGHTQLVPKSGDVVTPPIFSLYGLLLSLIPDPTGEDAGRPIVTDGLDGYILGDPSEGGGGGVSLPVGGVQGHLLTKNSSDDGDAGWASLAGRPTALGHAALPMPGSSGTGNLTAGGELVEIIDGTLHNAFPSVTLCVNGDLLAVWRQGTDYRDALDGAIVMSRSSDFGVTWSTPATIFSDTVDLRDPGVVALRDGRLVVQFIADGATIADEHVYIAFSDDNGVSWGSRIEVPFTWTEERHGSATFPVELEDGTLLVSGWGMDTGDDFWSVRVISTADDGDTWGSEVTIADGEADSQPYNESHIGFLPDGTLMTLIRASNADFSVTDIYRSISADDGATWSAPDLVLADLYGRPSWTLLASGGIVITCRRLSDAAGVFATSWDDGETWTDEELIEDIAAQTMAYAQPIEVSPGLVAVIFADAASTESSEVRFKYLADGIGVSPFGDILRLVVEVPGASDRHLTPQNFSATAGSPVLGAIAGTPFAGGFLFDQSSNEAIGTTLPATPADWTTFTVTLLWCPVGATSGDVVWSAVASTINPGAIINTGIESLGVTSSAPGVAAQVVSATTAAFAARATAFSLRIARTANSGSDTYGADALLLGVILTKAS
ncbi:sialidase family protein [Microbacterium sp. 2FI]|uniref:sialidase family protein n=1 Tax=Microbacterium sp. 2FI TaxID=2502193 RepID=UPI0010F56130|nr:sialidase family protein [Microbacterium sp. 2FI]